MARPGTAGLLRALLAHLAAVIVLATGDLNYVLQTYSDSQCRTPRRDSGSQQSWVRNLNSARCFSITAGLACYARCNAKLACKYGSGSGMVVQDTVDSSCMGAVKAETPLATYLSWDELNNFLQGACTRNSDSTMWRKFNKPMPTSYYPDCRNFASVANDPTGSGANAYETSYALQFYTDSQCTTEYTVDRMSTMTFSRFDMKIHRGAAHCYDYEDTTPKPANVTVRETNHDVLNFKLVCGNSDTLGNGYMTRKHVGAHCTGRTESARYWRDTFYPMTYPDTIRLFEGKCVRWNIYFVKYDRPWDTAHYPDCSDWACKQGYCIGGFVGERGTTGNVYNGAIKSIPGKVSSAGAVRATLSGAVALITLWLVR